MDGKLNCHLTAENAAFTKLRYLDNRVTDAETRLDVLEQETTQLDEALQNVKTDIQEKVETEHLAAITIGADIVDATNVVSDNVQTLDMTATTIDAETINVDNLQNVNALHGKIVDVERTIATIGQFTETQTTTANNGTTNTEELNVDGETNLTGQVNIDGDMTFTKDTGLSKLQGEYLEIDAANVVIDNKNNAEYALYVPGINGDALFGGSVAVQDTLAAKNLAVTGETYFKDGITLDNPTLENVTDGGYSTTALDVDSDGKLIKVKIAADVPGAAEMLEANVTRYNYGLLDKYKQVDESSSYHIVLSDTASYTFNSSGEANAYLENSDGLRYEFENSQTTGLVMLTLGIAHNNIFYVVVPTLDEAENVISAELRKINLNNMQVEYSIDVSEYFDVNMEDLGTVVTWLPIMNGNILSEDKPVLAIAGTNKYFDLLTGTLSTRDDDFASGTLYYLSKTNTWYELTASNTDIWSTNNKYTSIEDAALIDEPYLEGDNYITDAPAFSFGNETFRWISNGVENELALNGNSVLYRDENDNKVLFIPGTLIFNGTEYRTNLYNYYGYVVNEYIAETPYTEKLLEVSTENIFVAKDIPVEINGKYFVDGRWYDKVVTSYEEFMQFIVDIEQNYVSTNNYPKYFDVLYNNAGTELISSNPWDTVSDTLTNVKHFYRLIGLRSNMNGDGYFGSDSMTDNGEIGEVRDIESIFTFEQNFDFFAPPAVLKGNLLYENIEFRYVNGLFRSSIVNDLKNCNIFIEGQWTNAQNRVTFEHCEDVYFTAEGINTSTGYPSYYNFNGCNGMFVDTLLADVHPDITINLSTMLFIKCTSNSVTQYGPGANAHYAVTGTSGDNVVIGRKEITLV